MNTPNADAYSEECPTCDARPGRACVSRGVTTLGEELVKPHKARVDAARSRLPEVRTAQDEGAVRMVGVDLAARRGS